MQKENRKQKRKDAHSPAKIVVAGLGYVGMANAVLLAARNFVTGVDTDSGRVELVNAGKSPVADRELEAYLKGENLHLRAVTEGDAAYREADYVIVSTPTDYDEAKDFFDTSSVEEVIRRVTECNRNAWIVVKSTVPVGFTKQAGKKYENERILFSPEFLREGRALYDTLYPSRIIVGAEMENRETVKAAKRFARLLREGALKGRVPTLFMGTAEAEAVKLFANTYLALRVAYFNELDTYAESRGLNTGDIIRGVCLDSRIGGHYNNPSFGYGGYCLPKDTRQLLANYDSVPNNLIGAIVEANRTRKDYIAGQICKRLDDCIAGDGVVGIYRLTMKKDSDNFRQSSIQGIIRRLRERNVEVLIYEPAMGEDSYLGCPVVKDLETFKKRADLIVANRYSRELEDVSERVYTRDLFRRD